MDKFTTSFVPNAWDRNSEAAQAQTQTEALEHLTNIVGKYTDLDPASTADLLLNSFDRNNPEHLAIVNDIDLGIGDMVTSRVNSPTYAPGITAAEAKAQLESTGKNFYQLGPSDTIVYGYLADNNYLNEVLKRPLVSVDQFRAGITHQVDNEGNAVFDPPPGKDWVFGTDIPTVGREHQRLQAANDARSHYVANPGVFATQTKTLFPQHGFITQNGTGGTVAGQFMQDMAGLEDGAFRDVRAHTPETEPGRFNDFMKWVNGAGDGWKKAGQYSDAMKAFNRPSPMMPEGLTPESRRAYAGDPAQAQAGVMQWLLNKADQPSFTEYATSQGREKDITPNSNFWEENKLFWYDPATIGISAVTGGLGAVGKLAAGAGMRAATSALARGAAAGLADEVTEPGNLIIGATYPFEHLAKGTATKTMSVPMEDGTYEQREKQTTGALDKLEKLTKRVQQERNK